MRVAVAVVHDGLALDALFGHVEREADGAVGIGRRGEGGDFKGVERFAGITMLDHDFALLLAINN